MKIKYEEMIDATEKDKFADDYNKSQKKFHLGTSSFAVFVDKSLKNEQITAAEKNWKAHISIHPDDLSKAWDLIYPMLYERAQYFKIVNVNRVVDGRKNHEGQLKEAERKQQEFDEKYVTNQLSIQDLNNYAKVVAHEKSEYENILNDERELYKYLARKHGQKVVDVRQLIEEDQRISQGMQVTLYMPPGSEEDLHELLSDIDEVLLENNIRPGSIYKTDRPLGRFVSVRHPGAQYHEAVTVENYNPDNVPDNFQELISQQIDRYENELRQNIASLRATEFKSDMSKIEKHNLQIKSDLADNLEQKLDDFTKKDIKTKIQELSSFKNGCAEEIKLADKKLKHDQEWKPLVKNLALLISGVGALIAVVSLYSRVTTGRYAAFDNKEMLFDSPKVTSEFKERFKEIKGSDEENTSDLKPK